MSGINEPLLQGLDQKSLLKRMMVRPGVFVGANRLDYIQHFATGYMLASSPDANRPAWKANYEMQLSLFQTQGTVLQTTSINGWTLFYRCFGTSDLAVGQFAEMLHADIPLYPYAEGTPHHEASVAGDVSKLVSSMRFGDGQKPAAKDIWAQLFNTLQGLIARQCATSDEVRVYIWKEPLFTQLRYVFHTPEGWRDDSEALADPGNYQHLTNLHALIDYCPHKGFARMMSHDPPFYLHVHGEDSLQWDSLAEMEHGIKDEETLWHQFQKWKTKITASY